MAKSKALQYLQKIVDQDVREMNEGEEEEGIVKSVKLRNESHFLEWARNSAWDLPSAVGTLLNAARKGKLGKIDLDILMRSWDT